MSAVHPVAGLFPLLGEADLDALAADIEAHGLREPIWRHRDGRLLDGRNRLEACRRAGVEPASRTFEGPDEALLDFVLSLNLHRRHLTREQKRELIEKLLKARPERPDNATAKLAKASDKTVGLARRKLEASSEIPKLQTRVDAAGHVTRVFPTYNRDEHGPPARASSMMVKAGGPQPGPEGRIATGRARPLTRHALRTGLRAHEGDVVGAQRRLSRRCSEDEQRRRVGAQRRSQIPAPMLDAVITPQPLDAGGVHAAHVRGLLGRRGPDVPGRDFLVHVGQWRTYAAGSFTSFWSDRSSRSTLHGLP